MSTEIYYFSGTKNSLQIARRLKERLVDAEVIPIIPLLKNESVISKPELVKTWVEATKKYGIY